MYDDPDQRTRQDRRIRRSKRALAAALIELTSERPFNSITVRDITDQADVGYATFYRHFDSKDDLMLAVFDEITSELEATASEQGDSFFEHEGRLVFEHVQQYEGLYRSILQSPEFVRKLRRLLAQRIEGYLQGHLSDLQDPAFPLELAAHHMAVSVIGLIEWWLDGGMQLPVEEMARIYQRLVVQATWYALPTKNDLSSTGHFR